MDYAKMVGYDGLLNLLYGLDCRRLTHPTRIQIDPPLAGTQEGQRIDLLRKYLPAPLKSTTSRIIS
jgi:hypothetical protein